MRATRKDYLLKPDGSPHVIDDNGRTCSNGGDYHEWDLYYKNPKVYTGHDAQCKKCLDAKKKIRDVKQKEANRTLLINPFLMTPIPRGRNAACEDR